MKKFYSRFRIFLMMFAISLASVSFFTGLYEKWSEIPLNLSQVESETPLYVFPKYTSEMPCMISHCGGFNQPLPVTDKKQTKRNSKKL